jgi:hypothetical protein
MRGKAISMLCGANDTTDSEKKNKHDQGIQSENW